MHNAASLCILHWAFCIQAALSTSGLISCLLTPANIAA